MAIVEGMTAPSRLLSATDVAELVRENLERGDEEAAARNLTEAISRIIQAPDGVIPTAVLAEPGTTGALRYDTLLATAMAYALGLRGQSAPAWTTNVQPLDREWLIDGDDDAGDEFRAWVRARTPAIFLAKNILVQERDWIVW
jgi:hypothetical protein